MSACEAEMCGNWTGDGCVCRVLHLTPDVVDERVETIDDCLDVWEEEAY